MKCIIHTYLLNEHFSPEYAEAHHGGKESENNLRYEWEDELAVNSEVMEVLEHRNASFPLQGELPDGKSFRHDVPGMRLVEIISSDAPSAFVGASESIVDSLSITRKEAAFVVELFLKDYEPMANPIPGIYIASKEFPKELIF